MIEVGAVVFCDAGKHGTFGRVDHLTDRQCDDKGKIYGVITDHHQIYLCEHYLIDLVGRDLVHIPCGVVDV